MPDKQLPDNQAPGRQSIDATVPDNERSNNQQKRNARFQERVRKAGAKSRRHDPVYRKRGSRFGNSGPTRRVTQPTLSKLIRGASHPLFFGLVIAIVLLGAGVGILFTNSSSQSGGNGPWKGEPIEGIASSASSSSSVSSAPPAAPLTFEEVNANQTGADSMVKVATGEFENAKSKQNSKEWNSVYNAFVGVKGSNRSWSTPFVVYCADLCGFVDNGLFPKATIANELVNSFKDDSSKGTVYPTDATYEPKAGDIAVITQSGDGTLAIVKSFDPVFNQITVVEGDSNNVIKENTYLKTDVQGGFISPAYPKIAPAPLEKGQLIKLPAQLGKIDTFEGWSMITDRTSREYKLRADAGESYDGEGFGKINGYYVVAVRPVYGSVGDYITFTFEDGSTIDCIIGDVKGNDGEGVCTWGFQDGENVIEFIVNRSQWYGKKENPGTAKNHPEWGQYIVSCKNLGNFWGR